MKNHKSEKRALADSTHLEPKNQAETKKEREEEKQKDISAGLEVIYGSAQVDFSKIDKAQSRITTLLFGSVLILSLLAATAWGGFFAYSKFFNANEDEYFDLSLTVPEELISGSTAEIIVNLKNPTTVPLAALLIDVNLPSGFVLQTTSTEPTDKDKLIWNIGELAGLAEQTITIQGIWIAATPSETPVQAYASFRPANFNADFEDIAVGYITTLQSVITTKLEGPTESSPGENLTYSLVLENSGVNDLKNIQIDLDLPRGFYIESSEPALSPGQQAVWKIPTLEPSTPQTITFSGSYAADVEGFAYIDATVSIIQNEHVLIQNTAQAYTDILASDFSVTLAGGGSSEKTTVDMAGTLRLSIAYQNTGEDNLENVSLLLDFQATDSIPVNWSQASLAGGQLTQDGIRWSASSIGSLAPAQTGLLNLSFPIDDALGVGDADSFTASVAATTEHGIVRSSVITIYINTQAKITTEARYFDETGTALGSGAMPPKVGETTVYRLRFNLENSLHALSDLRLSATLPPAVIWLNQSGADTGQISFDTDGKTITWSVSSLPVETTSISAYADVSITPTADDIDTFVKLLSTTSLSAQDTVSGQTITRSSPALTTDLEFDDYAAGKGIVIE